MSMFNFLVFFQIGVNVYIIYLILRDPTPIPKSLTLTQAVA